MRIRVLQSIEPVPALLVHQFENAYNLRASLDRARTAVGYDAYMLFYVVPDAPPFAGSISVII